MPMDSELILKILDGSLTQQFVSISKVTDEETIKRVMTKIVQIDGCVAGFEISHKTDTYEITIIFRDTNCAHFIVRMLESLREIRPGMSLYYIKTKKNLAEYCLTKLLGVSSFKSQTIGDYIYYTILEIDHE